MLRTSWEVRELDLGCCAVKLTTVHVGEDLLSGGGVGVLQRCFSSVLTGWNNFMSPQTRFAQKRHLGRTFSK